MRSEKGTIRPYGVTVLPTAGSFRYKLISVSDGDKTGRQGRQAGSLAPKTSLSLGVQATDKAITSL